MSAPETKFRNKDHDRMMEYLEREYHPVAIWNHYAKRAAAYIKKLEGKLAEKEKKK